MLLGMSEQERLAKLTIEQLAEAQRLARDLANSGACNPHEMTHLWTLCDQIDEAVKAKRREDPVSAG
jgi:hypothetical protein